MLKAFPNIRIEDRHLFRGVTGARPRIHRRCDFRWVRRRACKSGQGSGGPATRAFFLPGEIGWTLAERRDRDREKKEKKQATQWRRPSLYSHLMNVGPWAVQFV